MAAAPIFVAVQTEDFDIGTCAEQLASASTASGAVVTFTGIVRELTKGQKITALYLEHYPQMTEQCLRSIVEHATHKWKLEAVSVIHRVGTLGLNDNIVFVGVCSAHRAAAFEAAQFIMDYLKRDAPFWKKEITDAGEHWVEQKQTDLAAAERWR